MLFNTLFLLAILPGYILARPVPHGAVQQRRDHRLIKKSFAPRDASEATPTPSIRSSKSNGTDDTPAAPYNSTESASGTDSAPSSKNTSSSSSSGGGVMNALFPAGMGSSLWSTAPVVSDAVALTMESFKPKAAMASAQPTFSNAPDGSQAMQIHFEKGAYDYKGPQGGISFYAQPVDLSNAQEATFSYSLYFSEGFRFNLGGKLPGLWGGDDPKTSISCSGGRRDQGCWSARFMFRPNGAAELYTYLPPGLEGNTQVCDVKPMSTCNDQYGASVARGAWQWKTGEWTTVSQRIKLNNAGQADGEIEVIADGDTVINLSGLTLRNNDKGRIQGIQMQSFFGGHEPEWASPQDQDIWTKDYSIAVTKEF